MNYYGIYIPSITVQQYAGCYTLGGVGIYFEKKPCWFHRQMMKLCLGFEWKDEVKQ